MKKSNVLNKISGFAKKDEEEEEDAEAEVEAEEERLICYEWISVLICQEN